MKLKDEGTAWQEINPIYRRMKFKLDRDFSFRHGEPTEIWRSKDAIAAGVDMHLIRALICKRDLD